MYFNFLVDISQLPRFLPLKSDLSSNISFPFDIVQDFLERSLALLESGVELLLLFFLSLFYQLFIIVCVFQVPASSEVSFSPAVRSECLHQWFRVPFSFPPPQFVSASSVFPSVAASFLTVAAVILNACRISFCVAVTA